MLQYDKVMGTVARMWADNVYSGFMDSLTNMLLYTERNVGPVHYTKASMSWHELARNQIVENMLGDWVLMLDTDHVFSPDLLERLLHIRAKHNALLVSGIYCYKFPPHAPVVNMWTGNDEENLRLTPVLEWDRTAEVIEVGATGAGCMLIDRKLLKRVQHTFGAPFSIITGLSEDYSFCYRCHKLGVPVTLAAQVECHHVVNTVLSVRDYAPEKATLTPAHSQDGKILDNG